MRPDLVVYSRLSLPDVTFIATSPRTVPTPGMSFSAGTTGALGETLLRMHGILSITLLLRTGTCGCMVLAVASGGGAASLTCTLFLLTTADGVSITYDLGVGTSLTTPYTHGLPLLCGGSRNRNRKIQKQTKNVWRRLQIHVITTNW